MSPICIYDLRKIISFSAAEKSAELCHHLSLLHNRIRIYALNLTYPPEYFFRICLLHK